MSPLNRSLLLMYAFKIVPKFLFYQLFSSLTPGVEELKAPTLFTFKYLCCTTFLYKNAMGGWSPVLGHET